MHLKMWQRLCTIKRLKRPLLSYRTNDLMTNNVLQNQRPKQPQFQLSFTNKKNLAWAT